MGREIQGFLGREYGRNCTNLEKGGKRRKKKKTQEKEEDPEEGHRRGGQGMAQKDG